MVDPGSEVTEFPALVVTLIVGATIVVIVYISSLFKSQKEEVKKRSVGEPVIKEKQQHHHQQHQQSDAGNAARKKKQQAEKWRPESKQNYTHPWHVTSLKGHGGSVLDIDFSPNGKFLASCAEDGGGSGTSSGSEGNKENEPALPATGLTRRQKKNHRVRREESASPGTVKKKTGHGRSKNGNNGYSKRYSKLGWNIPDMMLIQYLQNYLLRQDQLLWLGYPVESSIFPGQAIVLKRSRDAVLTTKNHPTGFDVNAREFVPKECIYASSLVARNTDPDLGPQISTSVSSCRRTNTSNEDSNRGEERKCVRCSKEFFVTQDGSYLTQEQCHYHWGRLKKQFDEHDTTVYECCRAKKNTKGCTTAKLHVWNGLQDNSINPLHGFVRTRSRKTPPPDGSDGAYALDCEMCFTTHGLELAKISVVGVDGRLVYDTYVKPENEIIDYNTRFSGVTAKEMNRRGAAKTIKEVQNDLMGFINADTIIIGHGVENDLIALKMIHSTVVDTSVVFPHYFGLPYRRSLKSLVECFLKRSIQAEATGHDSLEDARSCLELMFWKLRSDMGSPSPHSVLSNNRL